MPQFDIHGLDELIAQLDRMGRFDEVAPKMLEESVGILEEEVIERASEHWESGDMATSIKKTGSMMEPGGAHYICVRPTGKDSKGIRNMEKMAWLEYGVKGRPATPILTTAVLNAAPMVRAKMMEVFKREVGG